MNGLACVLTPPQIVSNVSCRLYQTIWTGSKKQEVIRYGIYCKLYLQRVNNVDVDTPFVSKFRSNNEMCDLPYMKFLKSRIKIVTTI